MSKKHKNRDPEASFVSALDRIARDPASRRELLWIRAAERGDAATVASIERVDPGVAARLERLAMRVLACTLPPADLDDPAVRRELFLRIHDERFRHHCARFAGQPCGCIECTGVSLAEAALCDAARHGNPSAPPN